MSVRCWAPAKLIGGHAGVGRGPRRRDVAPVPTTASTRPPAVTQRRPGSRGGAGVDHVHAVELLGASTPVITSPFEDDSG